MSEDCTFCGKPVDTGPVAGLTVGCRDCMAKPPVTLTGFSSDRSTRKISVSFRLGLSEREKYDNGNQRRRAILAQRERTPTPNPQKETQ